MMPYPSTTHYLAKKLNWMGRKLKSINDPASIKDWTEAMNCVFKTLVTFSGNKQLTAPTQMARRKLDIQRAESINVVSRQKDDSIAVKTKKIVERPLIMGKRTLPSRSRKETDTVKVNRIGHPSIRCVMQAPKVATRGVIEHGSSMEVDGDVRNLDRECQQRRKLWIKEWWKRALWRELDTWEKKRSSRTWGDYKEFIERMFVNGEYEILMYQMKEEILEVFPDGVPSQDISRKNMEAYLIQEKFKDFTAS